MKHNVVMFNASFCRQRVREQIARDRAEHKARQEQQKTATSLSTVAQPNTQSASATATKKEYTSCKLQVQQRCM